MIAPLTDPLDPIRNDENLVGALPQVEDWRLRLEAEGLNANDYITEAVRKVKKASSPGGLLVWFTKGDNWRKLRPVVDLLVSRRETNRSVEFPPGSLTCHCCRFGEGWYGVEYEQMTDAEQERYNQSVLALKPFKAFHGATGKKYLAVPCKCVGEPDSSASSRRPGTLMRYDRLTNTLTESPNRPENLAWMRKRLEAMQDGYETVPSRNGSDPLGGGGRTRFAGIDWADAPAGSNGSGGPGLQVGVGLLPGESQGASGSNGACQRDGGA